MLTLTCPHCRGRLSVRAENAGQQCKCPHCAGLLLVPASTIPPTPAGATIEQETIPPTPQHVEQETIPPSPSPNQNEVTIDPTPSAPSTESVNSVPGYDILGELGRGGMGVVYKAKHLKLNRIVALKMILAGGHASSDDLVRFLAEAEAVAAFQHPNIVQVYDTGQHNGLPYMALEFVTGGSLADKLKDGPMSAKDAAHVVEQIARGMNAAHQGGIVHRDLKPDNVLLANDGTPKVTDFGLAKRVEDGSGLTQTGAIMGTPSYMAPEQAGGEGKRVGPAADVYALGAILYACLTGRPPFQAENVMNTILQVMRQEPVPMRQLNPMVPNDLETICLKCLAKEPAKRYTSANDLAEDLRRWQAGEPITARPVGQVERVIKWVRRRPTQAAFFATAVVFLLTLVIGGPLIAWQQSNLRLEANKGKTEAENARKETQKALDETETMLARSLVRPLRPTMAPLESGEQDALLELAAAPKDSLRLRFLHVALRNKSNAERFWHRAPMAMVASVGLDSSRRKKALQLLNNKYQDKKTDHHTKLACACLAMELDGQAPEYIADTANFHISTMMNSTTINVMKYRWANLVVNMKPKQAHKVAQILVRQMEEKTAHSGTRRSLAQTLCAVAVKLEPKQAHQIAQRLITVMENTADFYPLLGCLQAVTAKLEPKQAHQIAQSLVTLMHKTRHDIDLYPLVQCLGVVTAKLERKQAHQIAQVLLTVMKKTDDTEHLHSLVQCLDAVAAKLEQKQAIVFCTQAAQMIVRRIETTKFKYFIRDHAKSLQTLVVKMEPKQAAQILVMQMDKIKDSSALGSLAEGLQVVAGKMEPKQAAQILVTQIEKAKYPNVVTIVTKGLRTVAVKMEPQLANKVAELLVAQMKNIMAKDFFTFRRLAEGLQMVTVKLEHKQAHQIALKLVTLMENTKAKNSNALRYLAEALQVVAAKMERKQAGQCCTQAAQILVMQIENTKHYDRLYPLAQGLQAVAAKMERKLAAQIAQRLVKQLETTKISLTLGGLAHILQAVAAKMEPKQAAQLLATQLAKHEGTSAHRILTEGLQAVAAEIDRKQAHQIAQVLITLMKKNTADFYALSHCLQAVAAKMESGQSAQRCTQAAQILVKQMEKTKDFSALYQLAKGLQAVAAKMERKQAAQCCTQAAQRLVTVMGTPKNNNDYRTLTMGLQAVAAKVEPKQASKIAHRLVTLMEKVDNADVVHWLSHCLQAFVVIMEPKQAAQLLFTHSGRNLKNGSTFDFALGKSLQAAASKMGPELAHQIAQRLDSQVERMRGSSFYFRSLGLPAVAAKMESKHAAVLLMRQSGPQARYLTTLKSVITKLAKRDLVETLKHPSCVDESRAIVLHELSKRTKQDFATTWQFVAWAEKHEPDLDLRSPLQLPDEYDTEAPQASAEPTAAQETTAPQSSGSVLYSLAVLCLWLGFVAALTASLIGLHHKGKLPTLSAAVHVYGYLGLLALLALGSFLTALLVGIAQFSLFSVFPALLLFALIFILLPSVSVVVPAWLLVKRIPARCPSCPAKTAHISSYRPITYTCRSCAHIHRMNFNLGRLYLFQKRS